MRMEGMSDLITEAPATIRLTLAHPTRSAHDLVVVTLTRDASGDYVGMLNEQTPGRWIVTLESDAWRLPITTVPGRLTEIHLGAAAARS